MWTNGRGEREKCIVETESHRVGRDPPVLLRESPMERILRYVISMGITWVKNVRKYRSNVSDENTWIARTGWPGIFRKDCVTGDKYVIDNREKFSKRNSMENSGKIRSGEKEKNNGESFEMKFWNTMKAFTIFDFNENYEK